MLKQGWASLFVFVLVLLMFRVEVVHGVENTCKGLRA